MRGVMRSESLSDRGLHQSFCFDPDSTNTPLHTEANHTLLIKTGNNEYRIEAADRVTEKRLLSDGQPAEEPREALPIESLSPGRRRNVEDFRG